jgi:hypothetical protein
LNGLSSNPSSNERWRLTDAQTGWLLLGIGSAALVDAVIAVRTGRITASYRKWGCATTVDLDREVAPIQFAIRVVLQVVVGFAFVFFGLRKLLVE